MRMSGFIWHDGIHDNRANARMYYLATTLAKQDIAQRYQRSRIGAFWLTINMAVMIAAVGAIFGLLFRAPMQEFLPFFAAGMILWSLISTCINEGCTAFSSAEGIILQVRMPLPTHVLRVLLRNIIIFGHNILIFPVALLIVGGGIDWQIFWAIPGFVLLILNLFWMMLVLGIVCTRFRDMSQIVQNIMQVALYVTPILWMPKVLPEHAPRWILELNPFNHLISIVREPLLGAAPSPINWAVSIVLLIFGGVFSILFFGHYKRRVAYWL